MFTRTTPDRVEYEEEIYKRDKHGRHRGRLDRRQYHLDEQFEDRPRPRVPTRTREAFKDIDELDNSGPDFVKEYARGSSAGPIATRPRRLSDDYVHVPKEFEHEHEDFRSLRPRRERVSPPGEVTIHDKYSRHSRGKSRGYDREWDMDIQRGRRKGYDDIYVDSLPRRAQSRPRMAEREELFVHQERNPTRRGMERDEVIVKREMDGPSASEPSLKIDPVHFSSAHQDVVTRHKHVDHGKGYVTIPPKRKVVERPGRTGYEEIEISRRRGRESPDFVSQGLRDIDLIDRRDVERRRDHGVMATRERESIRHPYDMEDTRAETDYYHRHTTGRAPMGETSHETIDNWGIVDVPPERKRVTTHDIGGGSREVSWQKYNGVRRSMFDAESEEFEPEREYGDRGRGTIGRSYVGIKDKRDDLWTEVTKDLVVKEAIEKLGYDYEETAHFFYIFAYLQYDDVAEIVDLSKDFRHQRRDRIREIQRERARIVPVPSY